MSKLGQVLARLRDTWRAGDAFGEHRLRTIVVALGSAGLAVAALVFGPDVGTSEFASVWSTVWATVLSIATVTSIYELVLRESHAVALRRFVRLNATVVNSGLETLDEETSVSWSPLFRSTASAIFVLVGPYQATSYLNALLAESRSKNVFIRFCFPDLPEGSDRRTTEDEESQEDGALYEAALARAAGADHRLGSQISSTIEDLVAIFERSAPHIGSKSILEIARYPTMTYMEGVVLDRSTVIMPIEAAGRPRGTPPICAVFTDPTSPQVERMTQGLLKLSQEAVNVEYKVAENFVRTS